MRRLLRVFCLTVLLLAVAARALPAADYFVAPTGDDANPGDSERPFRTIGRGVLQLAPGDSLVVTAGTYAESIVIARTGLAGAPITVSGLPGAVLVSPEPGNSRSAVDVYPTAMHVVVRGFEITGDFGETVFVRAGAQDIELAELDIHHNHAGIWIAGASRVRVRDTWVHHNARSGVRIFGGARDIQLTDVRAEYHDDGQGCAGDADGISVDDTVGPLELVRVQSSYNSEDGLDVSAPEVTMHEVEARANACSGVKLGGGGRLENMLITGSRIGLNVGGSSPVPVALVNSTLLDNGIGVRALGNGRQVALHNCVVSGMGKAVQISGEVTLREHHNILYRPDADSRLVVRTINGGELLYSADDINTGRWHVASGGQGVGTIAVDPRLDAAGRPLGARGPTIDSGDADDSPSIDLTGMPRPMGLGVDRGAVEYEPVPASVSVARVVVHGEPDGRGEVRLSVRLIVPADVPLDIGSAPVSLVLRGSAGTVTSAQVDDSNRSGRAAGDDRRRVRFRRAGAERVIVTMRQRDAEVRISLRAVGVNVAAVPDDVLWIDVVAGDVAASAQVTLRNAGGRLSLP